MTGDQLKKQFGQQLAAIRKRQGLTQAALAELCDISVEAVSFLERGIHGPRFDLLAVLATELNTPPAEFLQSTPGKAAPGETATGEPGPG